MNLHEIEESEFGRGPLLWDADPNVCCAAFQLGACEHTEGAAAWDEADEFPVTTREELFAAVLVAYADRGWSVPTGLEYASLDLLEASYALALR